MGMRPHHTCSRWEFILPPESIEDKDPSLLTRAQSGVRNSIKILEAKDEKVLWHPEDSEPYGSSKYGRLSGDQSKESIIQEGPDPGMMDLT